MDGRKVFAARVGSVADGRGVVSLDNVLLYEPPTVRARAAACVQMQQVINMIVSDWLTKFGAKR